MNHIAPCQKDECTFKLGGAMDLSELKLNCEFERFSKCELESHYGYSWYGYIISDCGKKNRSQNEVQNHDKVERKLWKWIWMENSIDWVWYYSGWHFTIVTEVCLRYYDEHYKIIVELEEI